MKKILFIFIILFLNLSINSMQRPPNPRVEFALAISNKDIQKIQALKHQVSESMVKEITDRFKFIVSMMKKEQKIESNKLAAKKKDIEEKNLSNNEKEKLTTEISELESKVALFEEKINELEAVIRALVTDESTDIDIEEQK